MKSQVIFFQSGHMFKSDSCNTEDAQKLVKTLKAKGLNNTFSEQLSSTHEAPGKHPKSGKPSPNSFTPRTREPIT